jgi:hypothetical protein
MRLHPAIRNLLQRSCLQQPINSPPRIARKHQQQRTSAVAHRRRALQLLRRKVVLPRDLAPPEAAVVGAVVLVDVRVLVEADRP